ncbi:MAG: ThiF family adenylyltransferase [Scytonematopsis contorta HA4267-MV1]|jgi:molybdopterin/thiamine biosynthesis adenylyltransferase|nr:ThiF family adenylyltransferase [Scytonematopsis contorta HA4267-MV1]
MTNKYKIQYLFQIAVTFLKLGSIAFGGMPVMISMLEQEFVFNPNIEIQAIGENISPDNAERLVGMVDLVVDCAPLFQERYSMNAEAVRQRKPIIECAMYELEAQITTIIPGETPCLSCLYPEPSSVWKRQFPVFGAVSGMVGCLGAMEAIKVLSQIGEPLKGSLLTCNLREMTFRKFKIYRDHNCSVCGHI